MIKKLFVFAFFTVITTSIFAQAAVKVDQMGTAVFEKGAEDDIKGNKYLYEDWYLATLVDKNGEKIENVKLNYNGHSKRFEMKENQGKVELNPLLYTDVIVAIDDNPKQRFSLMTRNDAFEYYRVIYEGSKIKFYERFHTILKDEEIPNYGATKSVKKYINTKKYFLVIDEEFIEIKRKDKDIIKRLGDKSLKNFVKNNKIKVKKDEDLVALLRHFETL